MSRVTARERSATTIAAAVPASSRAAGPEADLTKLRGELAEWERKGAAGQAQLEDLEASAGERAADDPARVDAIAAEIVQVRLRVEQAQRAALVVHGRVQAAERVFLQAEVDRLEKVEVAPAQAAFDAHQAKIETLQQEFLALEGDRFVAANEGEGARTSHVLAEAVALAQFRLQLLQVMVTGGDPAALIDERHFWGAREPRESLYPAAVWGPDAVVAAPEYRARVAAGYDRVQGLREALRVAQDELEVLRDIYQLPQELDGVMLHNQRDVDVAIERRVRLVETLPQEIEEARESSGQLTDDVKGGDRAWVM